MPKICCTFKESAVFTSFSHSRRDCAGEAVNQVDADVVESGILTVMYCADGLLPVMSAVEQTQLTISRMSAPPCLAG